MWDQSLGGRVAHTERYKQKRDEAMNQVRELKQQIQTLKEENSSLRQVNDQLSSELERLKKQTKL
ncbi:hypothetical protein [Leptodesmis sichuanensis]|uniref:hypothetical protein n=1 Tax=Leptodesmis sichuanensis TaxID=2906798 RepID=UPI001F2E0129|nr:hypothetical protein [Leptodesmis sichuanensis]UIE36013.1 hypothetical protein KIK02_13025 [Leptodesmis sichuanensis A121]